MNDVAGQNGLCTIHHEEWYVSGSAIGRGPQPPEYGVELLYPVFVCFFQRSHYPGFDSAHNKTIGSLDLTICLRVIDGGVIELNAQIGALVFHLISCEIGAVIGDDAVWDTITVYDT